VTITSSVCTTREIYKTWGTNYKFTIVSRNTYLNLRVVAVGRIRTEKCKKNYENENIYMFGHINSQIVMILGIRW